MRREEKNAIIDDLAQKLQQYNHFYLADISNLNAEKTSLLRRKCFEKDVKLVVVKNTLFRKALEKSQRDFGDIFDILKDSTSIMFCETANVPAKLIKEFRRTSDKPVLKAAFVEESLYIGDEQVDVLSALKSKNELIADIIYLLQSPAKKVVSQLQTGGSILAGVVKTLSEKEN
jgi:large subunit ribosomal protein L10